MTRQPIDQQRRSFLRQILPRATQYCAGVRDEYVGRPQMLLSDLGQFPDPVLRTVVPVFGRDTAYQFTESAVLIQDPATGTLETVLTLDQKDLAILHLFGQGLTLDEIATQVDEGTEVSSYLRVKSLFLNLARCAVCHPAQSLAEFDTGSRG